MTAEIYDSWSREYVDSARHWRPLYDLTGLPVAIMDTRDALGLCAPAEADFHALYTLRGRRVALVDLGPNA